MSPEQQDHHDLFVALTVWFKSQQVEPAEAASVCMEMLVTMLFVAPPDVRAEGIAALFASISARIMDAIERIDDPQ